MLAPTVARPHHVGFGPRLSSPTACLAVAALLQNLKKLRRVLHAPSAPEKNTPSDLTVIIPMPYVQRSPRQNWG